VDLGAIATGSPPLVGRGVRGDPEEVTEFAERPQGLLVAVFGASDALVPIEDRLARWVFARDRHACPNPTSPTAMREALPGSTAGWPCRHDAVNERTCKRAAAAYGLLMLQKQYSSRPPEPSPGGRKCSLSTMWL